MPFGGGWEKSRRGEAIDHRATNHCLHRRAGAAFQHQAQISQVFDPPQLEQVEPARTADDSLRVHLVVAHPVAVREPEQLVEDGLVFGLVRFAHQATARRKLFPRGAATPKYSATVAPRSQKLSRTPRSAPLARDGDQASTGTYSRV